MNLQPSHGGEHTAPQRTVDVHVQYLGSRRRYEQHEPATETLAQLKPKVLQFFGLKETTDPSGTKEYHFVHKQQELTEPSVTLGQLAHGEHELNLGLVEHFKQG